jgi:SP family sugar:H+ symporter-like MFS transporter
MPYVIHQWTGKIQPPSTADKATKDLFVVPAPDQSLTTSILSAGTFFGAIIAGDVADYIGRRMTIISGCFVFCVGCIMETAATGVPLMAVGRFFAGLGVGFISAISKLTTAASLMTYLTARL